MEVMGAQAGGGRKAVVGAGWLGALFAGTAVLAAVAPGGSGARSTGTSTMTMESSSSTAPILNGGHDAAADRRSSAGGRPAVVAHSVTFVSPDEGWALAAGPCSEGRCPSVYHTIDRGGHWRRLTDLAQSAIGIDKPFGIRFADPLNGWIFGEALLSSHDGGAHWHEVPMAGPVVALEASERFAFAVVDPCIHASDCGEPGTLVRSAITADRWETATVLAPRDGLDAQLAVSQDAVYVLPDDSELVASSDGVHYRKLRLPCRGEGPKAGDFHGASIGAGSAADVIVLCVDGVAAGSQEKEIYASADGARSFRRMGDPPRSGDAYQLTAPSPAITLVAASSGASDLYRTTDAGRTWREVLGFGDGGVGWTDLGFVDPEHGAVFYGGDWAFANDNEAAGGAHPGVVYLSDDGGATWRSTTLSP
jgi:photosystem II stability/assembly factor-like uncharacterized protein